MGSDLAEVQNVVDVSFPKMSEQVNAFAKNSITQFGLSEKMAKQFMGTYGAMSKSFGFSEQAAYEMSKTVTGLVGDVASFYNISQDLASVKLKAIWTGETEGLKDLGVVMTQTALNEYAMQQGLGKTVDKMSEAEKVALRYSFVQNKLAGAMGDFARTSDGWANQTRILSLRFEQLKATLGQGFITLFTPIIKGINTILAGLQKIAEVFTSVVSKIFGKQSEAISNVTTDYVGLGESAVESANETVNASKKAQKAIMGYDKLNILSNKKDSGSDSGGSSSPNIGVGVINTPTIKDNTTPALDGIISKITSKINTFVAPLKNISFESLVNSLEKLKNAFLPFAKNIFDGLEWGYFNLLVPLAKFTIESVIPTFLDLFSSALKVLNPLLTTFKDIFSPIWENLLKPFLSWTGDIVIGILKGVADALSNIGDWMSNHQGIVDGIVISLGTFFGLWKLAKLMAFIQMSGGISEAFKTIGEAIKTCTIEKIKDKIETLKIIGLYAKDFIVSIASGTAALVKNAAQWVIETGVKIASTAATWASVAATTAATAATWLFNTALAVLTSPITLVIGAIALLCGGIYLLVKYWDDVKNAAGACWDWIVSVWNGACEWFNSTIIQPVGDFFLGMWDGLKNGASNAWEGIKEVFSKVGEFFGNVFGNAWQKVKDIFSVGGRIFDGIKDGIVSAFKSVVNAIIRGINKVISIPFNAINNALGRIRDLDLPIIGRPFSWIPSIYTPQIPQLAEGAWFKARNPRLAIVGEGKENEIVAPESKIEDAVEKGNQKNNNQGTARFEFVIHVEYEDGRRIIKKINDTQIKDGKISLIV